jgi:hypothetical protein
MTFTISDVVIFGLLLIAINLVWSLAWKKYNTNLDIKRRINAADVLRLNNFTTHLYLAGLGTSDSELHKALNFFSDRGYVIMDKQNQIVGKVAEAEACIFPEAPAAAKPEFNSSPSFLRLVVDNSKY